MVQETGCSWHILIFVLVSLMGCCFSFLFGHQGGRWLGHALLFSFVVLKPEGLGPFKLKLLCLNIWHYVAFPDLKVVVWVEGLCSELSGSAFQMAGPTQYESVCLAGRCLVGKEDTNVLMRVHGSHHYMSLSAHLEVFAWTGSPAKLVTV